ncbi:MAG: Holliday junction branch migration protein RuvA [Acidobacteria bacterium]|nr:Holliday junction branch migration protein RuvA [Acidobacteriota bacterium]
MIAYLEGKLTRRRPDDLIISVGGVGYRVVVPLSTYSALPADGEIASLFIHTHVREDILALYGFATEMERDVFEALITVSGIGPRLATNILSGVDAPDLLQVIAERDLQRLQSIPGVGRKTAERIAVELAERARRLSAGVARDPEAGRLDADLVSALVNLGFSSSQAERAGRDARQALASGASLAEMVREALRRVSSRP